MPDLILAFAADRVWSHAAVVLNPHYKNMGNLFGSEFWTYLLPPRVGADGAAPRVQGRPRWRMRSTMGCEAAM